MFTFQSILLSVRNTFPRMEIFCLKKQSYAHSKYFINNIYDKCHPLKQLFFEDITNRIQNLVSTMIMSSYSGKIRVKAPAIHDFCPQYIKSIISIHQISTYHISKQIFRIKTNCLFPFFSGKSSKY